MTSTKSAGFVNSGGALQKLQRELYLSIRKHAITLSDSNLQIPSRTLTQLLEMLGIFKTKTKTASSAISTTEDAMFSTTHLIDMQTRLSSKLVKLLDPQDGEQLDIGKIYQFLSSVLEAVQGELNQHHQSRNDLKSASLFDRLVRAFCILIEKSCELDDEASMENNNTDHYKFWHKVAIQRQKTVESVGILQSVVRSAETMVNSNNIQTKSQTSIVKDSAKLVSSGSESSLKRPPLPPSVASSITVVPETLPLNEVSNLYVSPRRIRYNKLVTTNIPSLELDKSISVYSMPATPRGRQFTPRSRHLLLYQHARMLQSEQTEAVKKTIEIRKSAELKGCTFKPDLSLTSNSRRSNSLSSREVTKERPISTTSTSSNRRYKSLPRGYESAVNRLRKALDEKDRMVKQREYICLGERYNDLRSKGLAPFNFDHKNKKPVIGRPPRVPRMGLPAQAIARSEPPSSPPKLIAPPKSPVIPHLKSSTTSLKSASPHLKNMTASSPHLKNATAISQPVFSDTDDTVGGGRFSDTDDTSQRAIIPNKTSSIRLVQQEKRLNNLPIVHIDVRLPAKPSKETNFEKFKIFRITVFEDQSSSDLANEFTRLHNLTPTDATRLKSIIDSNVKRIKSTA